MRSARVCLRRTRPVWARLTTTSSGAAPPPWSLRYGLLSLGIGATAGSIGAVVGLGGGVIAVPLLRLATPLTQQQASATCLPVVFFTATMGAVSYHINGAEGLVDWPGALLIGSCGMLTAPLGVRLAGVLPGWLVSRALGWFMLAVIPLVLWDRVLDVADDFTKALRESGEAPAEAPAPAEAHAPRGPHDRESLMSSPPRIAVALGLGVATGVLGGAFGVGGGVFMVPILSRMTDAKTASATSLASVVPGAMVGALVAARRGVIVWRALPLLLAGASVSSYLAAQYAASRMSHHQQQAFFVVTMLALGGRLVFLK